MITLAEVEPVLAAVPGVFGVSLLEDDGERRRFALEGGDARERRAGIGGRTPYTGPSRTLLAAVQAADLVDALSGEGPLTVFGTFCGDI